MTDKTAGHSFELSPRSKTKAPSIGHQRREIDLCAQKFPERGWSCGKEKSVRKYRDFAESCEKSPEAERADDTGALPKRAQEAPTSHQRRDSRR
nr:MAG TPA: hypothetical protein [Caudoviricetes sp.]